MKPWPSAALQPPQSSHPRRWKPLWFPFPLPIHPLSSTSLLTKRYLALRLKSIAVYPGRYRWRCYCAATESSEHLEVFDCSQSAAGTDQAMEPEQPCGTDRPSASSFCPGPVFQQIRLYAPTAKGLYSADCRRGLERKRKDILPEPCKIKCLVKEENFGRAKFVFIWYSHFLGFNLGCWISNPDPHHTLLLNTTSECDLLTAVT